MSTVQAPPTTPDLPTRPVSVLVLGDNRTTARLIEELDRVLPRTSHVTLSYRETTAQKAERITAPRHVSRRIDCTRALLKGEDDIAEQLAALPRADVAIILGSEDEDDVDGDANALVLLCALREARMRRDDGAPVPKCVITEIRAPTLAEVVTEHPSDFLVTTDVVAMLLAQATFDPRMLPIYRELLDVHGAELCLVPREHYVGAKSDTFEAILAYARARGEIALGYSDPEGAVSGDESLHAIRARIHLNVARTKRVPHEVGTHIVVLRQDGSVITSTDS